MTRGIACAALLALLAGCATLYPTPPVTPLPSDEAFAWSSVLDEAVDTRGRVDVPRLATNRSALELVVAGIARAQPEGLETRAERLAFHINAYNALTIYAAVRNGLRGRLSAQDRLDLRLARFVVGGRELSLREYEDMIRGFGDLRVRFALHCMAASCPRLRLTPFTAERLDAELDEAARGFLMEPRNVQTDPARQVVRLSPVLAAHPEDYAGQTPVLLAYVNRYRAPPVPVGYAVEFMPFDWTLDAPPGPPS